MNFCISPLDENSHLRMPEDTVGGTGETIGGLAKIHIMMPVEVLEAMHEELEVVIIQVWTQPGVLESRLNSLTNS